MAPEKVSDSNKFKRKVMRATTKMKKQMKVKYVSF